MKNNIQRCLKTTIFKNKGLTLAMLLFITFAIVTALFPPLVLEKIVTYLSQNQEVPFLIIGCYFMFIAISSCCEASQNALITRFGQKITHELRSMMSQKLTQLPAHYYSQNESAAITSRFVNDVDTLDALFTNGIISMFADVFKIISVLIVITSKSKGLGLIVVALLPVLFALTRSFQKRMLQAQMQNRQAIAKVNAHIPEAIKNSRMISINNCQSFMEKRYDKAIQESYHSLEKANVYDSLYSPIIIVISSGVIAILMIMAATGETMQTFFGISVATSVALIAYVNNIFTPLESIGMEIQNIQSAIAGVKRLNAFLNEEERKGNDENAPLETRNCVICFDHVTFGYGKENVLENCSFQIFKNEVITLTGPSGAGKSTIFKLIGGFYTPKSGKVLVNGVEAHRIKDEDKRKLFGYVNQTFVPVNGTIEDQITCFDETISDEQINQVLQLVGLEDTIASFPLGIKTAFDTSLFSQGQIQLLSIARSLVAKPLILLLDEISANLDSKTEQKVHQALTTASKNRSVISISHRLFENNIQGRQIKIK